MCKYRVPRQRSQCSLSWTTYRGGEPRGNSGLESRRNKTALRGRRNEEEVRLVVATVRAAEEIRKAGYQGEGSVRNAS